MEKSKNAQPSLFTFRPNWKRLNESWAYGVTLCWKCVAFVCVGEWNAFIAWQHCWQVWIPKFQGYRILIICFRLGNHLVFLDFILSKSMRLAIYSETQETFNMNFLKLKHKSQFSWILWHNFLNVSCVACHAMPRVWKLEIEIVVTQKTSFNSKETIDEDEQMDSKFLVRLT